MDIGCVREADRLLELVKVGFDSSSAGNIRRTLDMKMDSQDAWLLPLIVVLQQFGSAMGYDALKAISEIFDENNERYPTLAALSMIVIALLVVDGEIDSLQTVQEDLSEGLYNFLQQNVTEVMWTNLFTQLQEQEDQEAYWYDNRHKRSSWPQRFGQPSTLQPVPA